MYLQNQGLPCPTRSTTTEGRRITKSARIPYFSHTSPLCPGRFFRFRKKGIRYRRSWTSPKGQSHPQTNRPNTDPTRRRNPVT